MADLEQQYMLEDVPSANGAEREVVIPSQQPGGRYVRVRYPKVVVSADSLAHPSVSADEIDSGAPSLAAKIKTVLIGTPIPTAQAIHERIGRFKALAVLSSDALSSVAYGTEASLAVLVTAGLASSSINLLLGGIIVALLAIVAFSYRQTIFHYPNGGGSYIVAKDNLNVHFGLVAAGALLIDYVLTVSVSIAAGVDALTSAFPALVPYNVIFGLAMILIIVVVNLRGVRESGSIFAAPTYLFVGSFLLMIVVGVIHAVLHGGLLHGLPPQPSNFKATEHLSIFLILTAFASGCSAMTGTEAISNGVPIFKPKQEKNAAATLVMMATLLGIMYAGTTFLTWRYGISPQQNSNPTVTAQLATIFFTGWFGWFFYVFQFATALILVLAANTSFADFPRLSSILARDEYLPHIFSRQGDRLVFNTGIVVLGILSAVLLVIFSGNTEALINLYALGVFTAFTMSQSGMVRRWLRTREPHWRKGLTINAMGALATGVVTLVIAVSKFDRGAWIVVILIPLLYVMFQGIHHHYAQTRKVIERMSVRGPDQVHHIVVVPIEKLDTPMLQALAYARSISPATQAVHVALDSAGAAQLCDDWDEYVVAKKYLKNGPLPEDGASDGSRPTLVVLESGSGRVVAPILAYIDALRRERPEAVITVVLPEIATQNFWQGLLHNDITFQFKAALLFRPRVITVRFPYRLPAQPDHASSGTL
jgi:amino acid transporter